MSNYRLTLLLIIPIALSVTISLPAEPDKQSFLLQPKYKEGEKWIVTRQSQYSCRFDVLSMGDVVSEKQFNIVNDQKYVKTFRRLIDGKPTEINHYYAQAEQKIQKGGEGNRTRSQLPFRGMELEFTWNEKNQTYEITSPEDKFNETVRKRLHPVELYRRLLPEKKVHIGESWSPDIKKPVSLFFREEGTEEQFAEPQFETIECSLENIRPNKNSKDNSVAVISILMSTGSKEEVKENRMFARLKGKLLFDYKNRKPVKLSLTSRPAGITFRKKLKNGELHVKDLGVGITDIYDTTREDEHSAIKKEQPDASKDEEKKKKEESR